MSPSFDPVNRFKLFVEQQKANAAAANSRAVSNIQDRWREQYAANVASMDKRAPLAYPVYDAAPLMQIVDDDGNGTSIPFPNLSPPGFPPEPPNAISTPLRSPNAGPDPLKVLTFEVDFAISKLESIEVTLKRIEDRMTRIGA